MCQPFDDEDVIATISDVPQDELPANEGWEDEKDTLGRSGAS